MANHKQALKRVRQNNKTRALSRAQKSTMRTQVKAARAEIQSGDASPNAGEVQAAVKALARAGQKGVLSRKTAARRIGRLMRAAAKTQG